MADLLAYDLDGLRTGASFLKPLSYLAILSVEKQVEVWLSVNAQKVHPFFMYLRLSEDRSRKLSKIVQVYGHSSQVVDHALLQ